MTVREMQVGLYRLGFDPGPIDGIMGPKTKAAQLAFLNSERSDHDGTLESALAKLPDFIEAKNLTRANRTKIDLIVIHTMESAEKPNQARSVARWFANQLAPTYPAPQASAHYNVDDREVVQSVLECDVAWHAGGANRVGIGIEHSGFASQTPEQWNDAYSRAVLSRSSELVAKLCLRFSIPIQHVTDLHLAGTRGICGHYDVTMALHGGKGHTDPGPHFPWTSYLEAVRAAAERLSPATLRSC